MYIYEKIDYSLFESRFRDCNRLNNFPTGLEELYDYLRHYAIDSEVPVEFDVIELCFDWAEIDIKDIEQETGVDCIDDLRQETVVLEIDENTIIYQVI